MSTIGISALHIRPGKCGANEPYMVNLVRSLSRIDTQNQYLIFVTSANIPLFGELGGNFKLVRCSFPSWSVPARVLYEQLILPWVALSRDVDVLHFPGSAISALHPFPTVVTIHTDSIRARASMGPLQRPYYDLFLRINRSATRIIAPTEVYKQQLMGFYSYQASKVVPVHHGYDSVFQEEPVERKVAHRARWGIKEEAILSVTSSLPHKNLPSLFAALEHLWNTAHIEPQLVLVGYIDHDRLEQYIRESTKSPDRMRRNILILPYMKNSDLPGIYNAASYLILPSKEECFGMPLIEGMACGLPIAASEIPAFREVGQDAACYFDPSDPIDISSKIHMLLSDKGTCDALVRKGKRVIQGYSWERTALETLEVYMQAIHSPS